MIDVRQSFIQAAEGLSAQPMMNRSRPAPALHGVYLWGVSVTAIRLALKGLNGAVYVAVAANLYLPMILRLTLKVRLAIILSAVVFVTGALGAEVTAGAVDHDLIASFPLGLTLAKEVALQAFLEMAGVTLLIRGMLRSLNQASYPVGLVPGAER